MSNRRGMTLIIALVMGALIGLSAMMLFSSVNTEMMISTNVRRINQAKISAASGISHFTALNLNYDTLRERAGGLQTLQILPMTELSNKTSYEVKIHFYPNLNGKQYVVESVGYYTKGEKVLATYPIKSLFDGSQ